MTAGRNARRADCSVATRPRTHGAAEEGISIRLSSCGCFRRGRRVTGRRWIVAAMAWPKSRLQYPCPYEREMNSKMAGDESIFPRIASSTSTRLSDWVTLVENRVVVSPQDGGSTYLSIDTMDYVSVLAVTADGRVPLVRQFRPAVRRFTLEFPGGMRDGDEAPQTSAIRELAEEAGLAVSSIQPLATFIPESGRLGNRM